MLFHRPVGARFWVWLIAVVFGCGIAAMVIFLLIGAATQAWGVLGAVLAFVAVLLGIAWVYDRRKQAQYGKL